MGKNPCVWKNLGSSGSPLPLAKMIYVNGVAADLASADHGGTLCHYGNITNGTLDITATREADDHILFGNTATEVVVPAGRQALITQKAYPSGSDWAIIV